MVNQLSLLIVIIFGVVLIFNNHIDKLKGHDIIISFSGKLDVEVLNNALVVVEKKLLERDLPLKYTKKIYNVLVECLQNIFHHGIKDENGDAECIFSVSFFENKFHIYSGNLIPNSISQSINQKISSVNKLTEDDVVNQYRKVLDNGIISDKGGSGLGFLDMKRKTKNNIGFDFFPFGENTFFMLNLTINIKS